MRESPRFSYDLAFDRNIGWITEWEQQALRGKRVAIAGMGGVGGVHLLTLARLGIGAFHIADFDRFELANFNRQVGATMATIGRPKAEVLEEMARVINPELHVKRFDSGVSEANVEEFLNGVDLFIDGLDFFVLDIRRRLFARCHALGIPAVSAAPIGMGAGIIAFVPKGMSFEQYFRLEGLPADQQYVRFLMGMAPRGLHRRYLVDPSRVDLAGRRGPSTAAACQLCAGVTAVAATKLLLGRGDLKPAPYHHHFDAYRGKLAVTRLRFGNAGPVQRLKVAIAQRIYGAMSRRSNPAPTSPPAADNSPLHAILDVARWAPSGDNAQPWRFRIVDDETIAVEIHDHSADDVYEYRNAEPTLLSAGMLLESMRIAASASARDMEWYYDGQRGDRHAITVRCPPLKDATTDPLYSQVTLRSVDRRPYRPRPLTAAERHALEQALGHELFIEWHDTLRQRWRLARLSARATDIRLRIPEAFQVHQRVIDWRHAHSATGIPAAAVGLDRVTLVIMRWAMRHWSRMDRLNRVTGTFAAALQLDYLPGLMSAAFFTLRPAQPIPNGADGVRTLLRAGQAIQRFWLTATKLGLAIQPGLATLAFTHYGQAGIRFTADERALRKARLLSDSAARELGAGAKSPIFIGRIGEPRGRDVAHRSTRLPLSELILHQEREPRGESDQRPAQAISA